MVSNPKRQETATQVGMPRRMPLQKVVQSVATAPFVSRGVRVRVEDIRLFIFVGQRGSAGRARAEADARYLSAHIHYGRTM